MLLLGMRAWRDFGTELYHTIKLIGYVLIPVERVQLARDHDHEPVLHTLSSYDLLGDRSDSCGSLDPTVAYVFAAFCDHNPTILI